MPISRRNFTITCTTASTLAMLAACSNPHSQGNAHPSASALPSNQQEGAPYPANMGHLDQILAIGNGHTLPEGTQVSSVSPAVKFAEKYPGGWGYVIAFTASDTDIKNYVTENTSFSGEYLEKYRAFTPEGTQLSDSYFNGITTPWHAGFEDGHLIPERPLECGRLVILHPLR